MMFTTLVQKYFFVFLKGQSISLWTFYGNIPNYDTANYADDNTPYLTGKDLKNFLLDLAEISNILSKWFTENHLKENPGKYHVVPSTNNEHSLKI